MAAFQELFLQIIQKKWPRSWGLCLLQYGDG